MKIECCVCLEDKKCLSLKCKHPLCNECYNKLIQKLCPLCRREIVLLQSKLKKIFNTSVEIFFFFLISLFVYYTDANIFQLNNRNYILQSNLEFFFTILRIIFELLQFLN